MDFRHAHIPIKPAFTAVKQEAHPFGLYVLLSLLLTRNSWRERALRRHSNDLLKARSHLYNVPYRFAYQFDHAMARNVTAN